MSGFLCTMVGATFGVVAAAQVLRSKKGITAFGNAQVSTAQSKFGGSSALFDGNTDALYITDYSGFTFTGDFTIEMFVRMTQYGEQTFLDMREGSGGTNTGAFLYRDSSSNLKFELGGSAILTDADPNIVTNQWDHIAVSRSGTSIKLFVNGTETASATSSASGTPKNFYIGRNSFSATSGNTVGYLDEIRISNSARYTSAFTPSTTPFVNDANTLLLIHCDGTNATTFFEDDNGSRSLTGLFGTGSAAISTTQSKFGGSSLRTVSANETKIAFPGKPLNDCGTGDWTIEFWTRLDTVTQTTKVFLFTNEGNAGRRGIQLNNQTVLYTTDGTTRITTANVLSATTWHHIAVVRTASNTTTTLYVDGTSRGTYASDTQSLASTGNNTIANLATGYTPNGYMDEFRISNVARYTSAFTPGTTPFVNDGNTTLLIHFDGTDGQTVFRDDNGIQGAAAKTLTASGNAQLSTAQYKFGTSSLLLDGNGDYLTVTNAHDFNFQKNDFTIEAWVRFDVLATSNRHTLISNGVSSFTTGWIKFAAADLGAAYYPQVIAYDYSSGGSPMMTSSTAVSNNTWYHLAWVRQSTNHYLYLDGVQVASATNGTAQGINVNMNLSGTQIGRYGFDNGTPPSATYLDGYIDEMRISNVARYTAAFTPSTTAFTPDGNTLFLSHFEGVNASTTVIDSAGRTQKGIQALGNAQVDTAQSKFGGASALFDGTGDYLRLGASGDFVFGSDNWTIEGWIRPTNNLSGYKVLYNHNDNGTDRSWITIQLENSTLKSWGTNSTGSWNIYSDLSFGSLSVDTWYHFALVRDGSTMRAFLNGTQINTASCTGWVVPAQTAAATLSAVPASYWYGWMDDIRISNTARYTAAFTPSTTPFQNDDNTLLLLHMDGTDASTVFFDDNGAKPYTP